MRKHYVVFYSPGTLVDELDSVEIDSWDTVKAAELSKDIVQRHGAKPYGFRFETYVTADPVPDGEGGFLEVRPQRIRESGTYFINGELSTIDDVENRKDPKEKILLSNMKCAKMAIICVTKNNYRHTALFDKDSFVVNDDGEILNRGDDPDLVAYRKKVSDRIEKEWADKRY